MKYIPSKYLEDAKDPRFKLSEWEFIEMNLGVLHIDEDELLDIFDISRSELENWKRDRRNIPIDKVAVLCSMFDVTIDQYLDRDSSFDEFYRIERLSQFRDLNNWKHSNIKEVFNLFRNLMEAQWSMEALVRGHYQWNEDDWDDDDRFDEFDYLQFCCSALDMDVTYDYKNGEEKTIESVQYSNIIKIADRLQHDWGKDAQYHFWPWPNDRYIKYMLLTENPEFLTFYLNTDVRLHAPCELLEAWQDLKNKNPSFDIDYHLARILLANGATFENHDEPNKTKTLELCLEIMKHDAEAQISQLDSNAKKENN